ARSLRQPGREQLVFNLLPGGRVQRGRLALLDQDQDEALRSRHWTDQLTWPVRCHRLRQWGCQVLAERLPTHQPNPVLPGDGVEVASVLADLAGQLVGQVVAPHA